MIFLLLAVNGKVDDYEIRPVFVRKRNCRVENNKQKKPLIVDETKTILGLPLIRIEYRITSVLQTLPLGSKFVGSEHTHARIVRSLSLSLKQCHACMLH